MLAEESRPRRRRKGTERVKAWIYSVLNPLMEDLRAENKLLAKKNITWRYQTAEMEFIKKARDLISPSARPNYDDLLRSRPDLQPSMAERDAKVETLQQAAHTCWKFLTDDDWFQSHTELNLQTWLNEGNPYPDLPRRVKDYTQKILQEWTEEGLSYPGGAVPKEEFWLQVAEYVMNNIQTLPYHYSSQKFWHRFQMIFLIFRHAPTFSELEKAILKLQRANEKLIETLDLTRSQLCEEYDVPAAPIS